jgi:hypothetical protein
MSDLKNLQFQKIDDSDDDISDSHKERIQDEIVLDDDIDETKLENYWDNVVDDIHKDPTWFDFSNDD